MCANVEYLKRTESASISIDREVTESVQDILGEVRERGDEAVAAFTEEFDGVERERFRVDDDEIEAAREELSSADREAIDNTVANVREFHEEQREHIEGFEREFEEGVRLGQRIVPVESAGTYVPGGRHPLVAAPAMSIVPAKVAGVERVVTCAPPQENGTIQPAQLYAMDRAGADEIYCIGGAQAIGAMAYGTDSVPGVAKVTGPGNVFVTEAKRQVFGHVGIDFLAGPSEVLVLADSSADPDLVATDLLAQAEHDPNSRPILVSTDRAVAEAAVEAFHDGLSEIRTADVAGECWENNGEVVVAETMDDAVEVVNDYAIEHLQVMIDEPRSIVEDLTNYGSLFLGEHSPVVFGDKAVGTNHSLPTLEVARYSGGIWVGTYTKTLTHQEATAEGAARIAPWAAKICELEGTHAHQLSAEARLRDDISPDYGPGA
ncbi:histidinol dehydrogenase [Halalkalicoccus sp. NIPERK01]|uniref:histidinol dehydrogenase n=1 Tax=Halalkalicoccus sp. NIPERK01 TaxID=3053469 RepID=UPI00256F6639|nr:histidinol dehydrogenase [Halalkalicoccus sp. NIPERK01]MDL5363509.1 histidinol dehydrogenase [Halalkalicoccus sp. NIPERK01]